MHVSHRVPHWIHMGKSIRIYLADGTVAGIRHAEIVNWTGQALACPRSRFQELREWAELKRPGVYFLVGSDEQTADPAVYIGEAEVVLDRLVSHFSQKDFWTELVAFTSKDENLTKGHVRFLESRLVGLAQVAGRYIVQNTVAPQTPALPRSDRDAMEEYLDAIRTLLGVLGHRLLEPLLDSGPGKTKTPEEVPQTPVQVVEIPNTTIALETLTAPVRPIYHLRVSGLSANAMQTDEGLVVLMGSEAAASEQPSLSYGYRGLRQRLIQTGVLVPKGTFLRFTRDHLFSSPSQAAAVIVGYATNGRREWRMPDGTTYAEFEQRTSQSLLDDLSQRSGASPVKG